MTKEPKCHRCIELAEDLQTLWENRNKLKVEVDNLKEQVRAYEDHAFERELCER